MNYDELIKKVHNATCTHLGIDPDSIYLDLHFATEKEMRELNHEYRGKDQPTDVLSFPLGEIDPATGKKHLGDIIICEAIAEKQSFEYGHSIKREIAFLYVHGMLHLLGYNHESEGDEAIMDKIQDEILNKVDVRRE